MNEEGETANGAPHGRTAKSAAFSSGEGSQIQSMSMRSPGAAAQRYNVDMDDFKALQNPDTAASLNFNEVPKPSNGGDSVKVEPSIEKADNFFLTGLNMAGASQRNAQAPAPKQSTEDKQVARPHYEEDEAARYRLVAVIDRPRVIGTEACMFFEGKSKSIHYLHQYGHYSLVTDQVI